MSLERRLTLYLVAAIGLPLVAVAATLAVVVPSWLRSQFDDALETRARALVSLTVDVDGEVELEFSDQFMPEFEAEEDPYYFELWLDGELLERSRSFHPSRELRLPDLGREEGVADEPRLRHVVLPDGRPGRQVRIDFVPEVDEPAEEDEEDDPEEEPFEEDPDPVRPSAVLAAGEDGIASVLVAGSTERLDGLIVRMQAITALSTVVLLLLLVAVVRFALRLGLRPLGAAVRRVATIDAESLARRVDAEDAPAELRPLLEGFNRLLDRVETAFRRERRLTADMAHELKTPIAELRSLGEVGERWPDDGEAARQFFVDARDIATQMERVVAQLLELARHDAGRQVVRAQDVNLRQLVSLAWRAFASQARSRRLRWDLDVDPALTVHADPVKLELILSNLLRNAVSYSRAGSGIRCSAHGADDGVHLVVANDAENLQPADLDLMFDRFWRKEEARTGGHSAGLGLSLVRAFATLLGIGVEPTLSPEGRLEMKLVIPPRPAGAGTSDPAAGTIAASPPRRNVAGS